MLVLSRREGESVRVGDGIVVTVVRICGNKVRVGVEADKAAILRAELRDKDARAACDDEQGNDSKAAIPQTTGEKNPVAA